MHDSNSSLASLLDLYDWYTIIHKKQIVLTRYRIHNIYKLQKHVSLSHQSYLIVFIGNKNVRFLQIMSL